MFLRRHLVTRPFGSRKAFTVGGPIQQAPICLYSQKYAISSCTSSQSSRRVKLWARNLHPVFLAQVQGLNAVFPGALPYTLKN
jgi:hypothetical protein